MSADRRRGPSRRRVTIRDVASTVGMSTATVSHALNGKGRVDPATRRRIIAVADRLGYRPSRAARALRTQRTEAIAFVVPGFGRAPTQTQMLSLDLYMHQASAAARAAFAANHSLLLVPSLSSVGELDALGVDGGIVCDPLERDPLVALFERLGLPVVTIERRPELPSDPWHVRADNEANTRTLLDHLAGQGADRIAMLTMEGEIAWKRETERAYLGWCAEHDREPTMISGSPHELEGSAYALTAALLDSAHPPDAIFASVERYPSGVIRAARERGVRIPDDLMLAAGIDGHETREAAPPVSAIDVRPELQGTAAAELLIARIQGASIEAPRTTPSEFHVRGSTLPARLNV